MKHALLWPLAALLVLSAMGAESWKMNYFFDETESTLEIVAIQFPSDQRGVVIGMSTIKGKQKPVALVTADGGKKWTQIQLKESPYAIHCLNDSQCWMATERGIWTSEEGGRDWKKLKNMEGVRAIHFISSTVGYAAGGMKLIWKTQDGGKTWEKLPEAAKPEASAENSIYTVIASRGKDMLIAGSSNPPRRDRALYPDWMEPERAAKRREWPSLVLMLETRDAGKNWSTSSASVFGRVTGILLGEKSAISLIEYQDTFQFPSEVLRIDYTTGKNTPIFAQKQHAITSIAYGKQGELVVGGIEAFGSIRANPIPSKVRILTGQVEGLQTPVWVQMPVDYRAVAHRVHLARTPSGKLFAATDTGMILELR